MFIKINLQREVSTSEQTEEAHIQDLQIGNAIKHLTSSKLTAFTISVNANDLL